MTPREWTLEVYRMFKYRYGEFLPLKTAMEEMVEGAMQEMLEKCLHAVEKIDPEVADKLLDQIKGAKS